MWAIVCVEKDNFLNSCSTTSLCEQATLMYVCPFLVGDLGVACVVHSTQHTRHSHDMLPHHHLTYKDTIYRVFKHNFSQAQYKLPDDGRRPKHVGAIFV
jgi:hypothetical protein